MFTHRQLDRAEIPLIWTIDRAEYIENLYRLQDGELVLEPHNFAVTGWPPGEADIYLPILLETFERGGYFDAAFDGERLAGLAVVDPVRHGGSGELVQLSFFHVGRPYRKMGLGSELFEGARLAAVAFGARGLYISATPSENTINFYLARGCALSPQPDPELFALEPEDIHLELHFAGA